MSVTGPAAKNPSIQSCGVVIVGYRHLVKKCSQCLVVKPTSQFYGLKTKRGRDGYCKKCRRVKDRARQESRNTIVAAKKSIDPLFYRRKKLVKLYGITHEKYEQMFAEQNGLCAICKGPEVRILYGVIAHLVIDHDHKTNKIRGLLCHRCNISLAPIDDLEFRRKAIIYLRKYHAIKKQTA